MRTVDLRELIDANLRGRTWASLARAVGMRSPGSLRNWADGKHPMPEFRADAIAEYLGVPAVDVVAAAKESVERRTSVGSVGHPSTAAERAAGGRASAVQVEAVREFITTLRAALDSLEAAFEPDDEQP